MLMVFVSGSKGIYSTDINSWRRGEIKTSKPVVPRLTLESSTAEWSVPSRASPRLSLSGRGIALLYILGKERRGFFFAPFAFPYYRECRVDNKSI